MKITLSNRVIPRNTVGDPAFRTLYTPSFEPSNCPQGVLDVFTPDEVVELVNRALYQALYQQQSHAKRSAHQTEVLAPVKRALRRLYPGVSWAKATPQQIEDCVTQLKLYPRLGEEEV